jgi:hypothetical protein
MSSKCDPRGKIHIWLSCFDGIPDGRPEFIYRRLSTAECDRMAAEYEAVSDDAKSRRAKVIEIAAIGLLDWENQVDAESGELIPFSLERFRDVINHFEADELIGRRMLGGQLALLDKKKYESQA